jgi:hypothetical protein
MQDEVEMSSREKAAGSVMRAIMAAALKKEWEASSNGRRTLFVEAGAHKESGSGQYAWRFLLKCRYKPALPTGRQVSLNLKGLGPMRATVVEHTDQAVTLDVRGTLPALTPPGCLHDDPQWILESLRHATLADLSGGRDRLALALLGLPLTSTSDEMLAPRPQDDLNEEQQEAVRLACGDGVLYLDGPPGTGKTRTLGALVEALVSLRRRVLVVAPSNTAADQVAMAICQRLEGKPALQDGQVIRLGNIILGELRQRFGDRVWPEGIARRKQGGGADVSPEVLAAVRLKCIRNCRVLVTTVHQTFLRRDLNGLRFDTVVIDEAGMTSLPLAYHAATLARRSVVVAGDYRQLPAVTRSRSDVVKAFYRRDVFYARGIPAGTKITHGARVRTLRTQYRMDPPIAALLNDLAYGRQLKIAASVRERPALTSSVGDAALVLLDSSPLDPQPSDNRGLENETHAKLIARDLPHLIMGTGNGGSASETAILTRFNAQRMAIRAALRRAGHARTASVSTVHALQGGEADTVILDFSAAGNAFLGDYLIDTDPDDEGVRLLTVALSRARRRIVVVANVPLLLGHPGIPPSAMSLRLLRYLQQHALIRRAQPQLDGSPPGREATKSSNRSRRPPLALIHDLGGDGAVIALARWVKTVDATTWTPSGKIPPSHWRNYLLGHVRHPSQVERFGQHAVRVARLIQTMPDRDVLRLVRHVPMVATAISGRGGLVRRAERLSHVRNRVA